MAQADVNRLVISSAVVDVLVGNPGLDLTIADAATFRLEGGCIRLLRYGSNSEDLSYVLFKNGNSLSSGVTGNLKDFRETFECAAKHGMGVTYCVTADGKRITMVNLYPCLCSCGPREGRGDARPARDFFGLSAD